MSQAMGRAGNDSISRICCLYIIGYLAICQINPFAFSNQVILTTQANWSSMDGDYLIIKIIGWGVTVSVTPQ
jgi:hypothetical protein